MEARWCKFLELLRLSCAVPENHALDRVYWIPPHRSRLLHGQRQRANYKLMASAGAAVACSAGAAVACSAGAAVACSTGAAVPCSAGAAVPCSAGAAVACSAGAAVACINHGLGVHG